MHWDCKRSGGRFKSLKADCTDFSFVFFKQPPSIQFSYNSAIWQEKVQRIIFSIRFFSSIVYNNTVEQKTCRVVCFVALFPPMPFRADNCGPKDYLADFFDWTSCLDRFYISYREGRDSSNCWSRAMGTIGADCSRVARATTPGPPPQPHGWMRLGFEVSRFPHFWVGGLACAEFPRGVEFRGSLAPFFFSTSLNKKKMIKEVV